MQLVKNCAVIQILIVRFKVIESKCKERLDIVIINMVWFGGFSTWSNRAK